jgi:hypothetical protein
MFLHICGAAAFAAAASAASAAAHLPKSGRHRTAGARESVQGLLHQVRSPLLQQQQSQWLQSWWMVGLAPTAEPDAGGAAGVAHVSLLQLCRAAAP